MNKPKLLPLNVPWSVSPSTPYLRLVANESPDDPTHVQCVAYFGPKSHGESQGGAVGPFESANAYYPPYKSNIKLGAKEGPLQLVKMSFTRVVEARIAGAISDASAIDYAAFDCSAMQFRPDQMILDPSTTMKAFREKWAETEVCPDPRVYEVQGSVLITNFDAKCFNHYIVVGHDAYIEIIATAWKWESEGALRD